MSTSNGQNGRINPPESKATKIEGNATVEMPRFEGYVYFDDPHKQREYLKTRLALAFRIFAKFGFDDGVAGHITLRVSSSSNNFYLYLSGFRTP